MFITSLTLQIITTLHITYSCFQTSSLHLHLHFALAHRECREAITTTMSTERITFHCPLLPGLDNCFMLYVCESDNTKYLTEMELYSICPVVTGLFHSASCPHSLPILYHILSIFLCAYWPFIALWRNVRSNPLSIFKFSCLVLALSCKSSPYRY